MRLRTYCALLGALALLALPEGAHAQLIAGAWAQTVCPATASTPQFTAGGNVFGRTAPQWNAYFGAKVDVNHGILCYPTIYPPITGTTFADPTGVVGVAAVPGIATTAMRSDAAPRAEKASATVYGLMKVDNATQGAADGVVHTNSTSINGITCTPGGSCTIPAGTGTVTAVAGANGIAVTPADPCLSGSCTVNLANIADHTVLGNQTGGGVPVGIADSMTLAGHLVHLGDTQAIACGDLSDDGTACTASTGTSGHALPFLDGTNTWSGTQTFGTAIGAVTTQSGTGGSAYTFAAADCGTTILATGASAATYTVPNSLPAGCHLAVSQETAGGQVTIAAGAGATFNANPHGYTKTYGQYAIIGVSVKSNSGGTSAVFTILGDGA